MQGHPAVLGRHFCKVANAAQVVGMGEGEDAAAKLAHARKGELHGLHPHPLAKTALPVQPHQGAGVHTHGCIGFGVQAPFQNGIHIARGHAHAM